MTKVRQFAPLYRPQRPDQLCANLEVCWLANMPANPPSRRLFRDATDQPYTFFLIGESRTTLEKQIHVGPFVMSPQPRVKTDLLRPVPRRTLLERGPAGLLRHPLRGRCAYGTIGYPETSDGAGVRDPGSSMADGELSVGSVAGPSAIPYRRGSSGRLLSTNPPTRRSSRSSQRHRGFRTLASEIGPLSGRKRS